ncbi:flippase [soil metagenome]
MRLPPDDQHGAPISRIARGAGISSLGQGIGRILGYATQVALARMYGPANLGFYVLGFTIVQVASIFSQFGMNYGVLRYVARYRVENDISRMRGTILLALWASLVLSLLLALLMFFGSGFLAERVSDQLSDKPTLTNVFRIFAVSLPFFTVMSIALWATQGFQTVKYATIVEEIQRPALNLALVVVFYLLGAQILGAVLAYALSMMVGVILSLYYLRVLFPKLLDRHTTPKLEARLLVGASAPVVVANFSSRINDWVAVWVVGFMVSADAVGIFNTAARTAALSALILAAFKIFTPMVSDLYSRGELAELGSLYKDISRWAFTGSLALFLVIVPLAKDIMVVFGPEFVSGWVVLIVIGVAQLFNSSTGHTARILAMTGYQNVVMVATLGATTAGIAATIFLVPIYGILGAGVAIAASVILSNIVTLFYVKLRLGLWPYNRGYYKPLAAGILAAGGAYLLKLALPIADGIPTVLVIAPLSLLGFAALMMAFGLTYSDREFLAALWRAIRAKMQPNA